MTSTLDHVYMINAGWAHRDLNVMDEEEFSFWLGETVEFDRLKAEARAKAAEKAGRL